MEKTITSIMTLYTKIDGFLETLRYMSIHTLNIRIDYY
jgi:hypothetical protein